MKGDLCEAVGVTNNKTNKDEYVMNHKINSMASALSAALSTKWVLSSVILSGLILSGCQSSGLYNPEQHRMMRPMKLKQSRILSHR